MKPKVIDEYGMIVPIGETLSQKYDRESKWRWEQKKEWRDRWNKETAGDCEVIYRESVRVMEQRRKIKKVKIN
jgi:hypothetical protein